MHNEPIGISPTEMIVFAGVFIAWWMFVVWAAMKAIQHSLPRMGR